MPGDANFCPVSTHEYFPSPPKVKDGFKVCDGQILNECI